jgi:lysozyme
MSYIEMVKGQLRIDEGWERKPYKDTVGKLSAGCGRNLDDVGLRDDEIALMLSNDVRVAENDAINLFVGFEWLSDVRKAVLVNMAFNLGHDRLSKFVKLRAAVKNRDFEEAAKQMLDSTWAAQVGLRAVRLAKQMREG